ncbi:MAG: membrane protein [Gammaproteobacteria bacterium]|nr:MAG: membrane protein [Gammaproteobacteria bacterium]
MRALLVLLLAASAGCAPSPPETAPGLLERPRIVLRAERSETVAAWAVQEGAQVEAGELLLQLDDARARAEYEAARQAAAAAAARLAELERGSREEDRERARARLAAAEHALALAEKRLERTRALAARGLAAPEALDEAESRRDVAAAERDAARADWRRVRNGPTAETLAAARAEAAAAAARAERARLDLEKLAVRAPVAGRVDALPYEVGSQVPAGAVVAVLLAGERPYARVYLPEPALARVPVGSAVRLRADGVTEPLHGRVRHIEADPVFTPYFTLGERDRSRLSYVAEVDLLDAAAATLPAGLPVRLLLDAAP